MKRLLNKPSAVLFLAAICILSLRVMGGQGNQVDKPSPILVAVAPTYPPVALAAGVSGEVKVEVAIKADGSVSSAKIASGHRLLREGCEEAAKEWIFAKATESGEKRKAQLTFAFFAAAPKTPARKLTTVFKSPLRVEITRRMDVVTTP